MRSAIFLVVLCVGCSEPATSEVPKSKPTQPYIFSPSPNESAGDRLKREHIYQHIQRQRVRERFLAGATTKVDLEGDCKRQYDSVPIQELYDIARFKFGYVEPK